MDGHLELASLADDLSHLHTSPEKFSSFYRKLIALRFPLQVAEVLELRSLFNQTIDELDNTVARTNYQHFRLERQIDLRALGIEKAQHVERLVRMLALLREYHLSHSIASRDAETYLRRTLADNDRARHQSLGYGKVTLLAALASTSIWLSLSAPGWPMHLLTLGLFYLCGDYFYSLSILKREAVLLNKRLDDVLNQRVASLDWNTLTRNVALILGYARISGVEAFLLEGEQELPRRLHS